MKVRFHLLVGVILLGVIGAFFWFDPRVDQWASGLAYEHGQFLLAHASWAYAIRRFMNALVWFTIGLSAIGFFVAWFWKGKPQWLTQRVCLYIVLCFAIAPGLLVNAVLKNHWGRPRPLQTNLFGGHDAYQKVWVKSDVCPTNCSFVCGDCAAAFAFFCFVPLVRRKKTVFTVVALFGLLLGAIRLLQGGHYLSDVLSAYAIDYIVIMALYGLMFKVMRSQVQAHPEGPRG